MGACIDRILVHVNRPTFTTENDNSVCEGCSQTFTAWRKKKICKDCGRCFCSKCMHHLQKNQCKKCQILISGIFTRSELMDWKINDLKALLHKCKVDISACCEKEDLIDAVFTNFGGSDQNGSQSPSSSQSTVTPNSSSQMDSQNNRQTDPSVIRQSNQQQQQQQQQWLNDQQWEQQQQHAQMTGELFIKSLRQQQQQENSSSQVDNQNNRQTDPLFMRQNDQQQQQQQQQWLNDQQWEQQQQQKNSSSPMDSQNNRQTDPSLMRQNDQQQQQQQQKWLNNQQQEQQQQHAWMTGELLPEPLRQQQQQENSTSQMDRQNNRQADPSVIRQSNQQQQQQQQQWLNNQQQEQQQHHEQMTGELLLEALRQQQQQEVAENSQRDNQKNDTSQETEALIIAVQITLDDIKSEKDIDDLSIKQLKKLLLANFVNYKGCCERWELEQRVKRLWKEDQINKQKAEEVRKSEENPQKASSVNATVTGMEDDICKICMNATVDCVRLECGHMVTCTSCRKQLSECPMCRQYNSCSQMDSQNNRQTDSSHTRQSDQQQQQQQLNDQQWEQLQQHVQMTGELLLKALRQQHQQENSSSQIDSQNNRQTDSSLMRQSSQQQQQLNDQEWKQLQQHAQMTGELLLKALRQQQQWLNDQQQEQLQKYAQMTELLLEALRQQQQNSSSQMDSLNSIQTDPSLMRQSNQQQQQQQQQWLNYQQHVCMPEFVMEPLRQQQQQEVAENSQRDSQKYDTSQETEAQIIAVQITLDDIKSEKDIDDLSIKQLKKLLLANFVDYKGCCERWELEQRVKRLWKEVQINKQKAEEVRKAEESIVAAMENSSKLLYNFHYGQIDTQKTSSVNATVTGNEDDICKICMDATIDCILLECGHMVTCTSCGKQLAECPMCRQYVSRAVHIFKS